MSGYSKVGNAQSYLIIDNSDENYKVEIDGKIVNPSLVPNNYEKFFEIMRRYDFVKKHFSYKLSFSPPSLSL